MEVYIHFVYVIFLRIPTNIFPIWQEGVDVVWETVGGEMFETCLVNLANKGRLVIVGGISSYKKENEVSPEMDISYLPALVSTIWLDIS